MEVATCLVLLTHTSYLLRFLQILGHAQLYTSQWEQGRLASSLFSP